LDQVTDKYLRPILEVFGPELKSLYITDSGDKDEGIKMASLAQCPLLESLTFYPCLLDQREDLSTLNVTTFLPHLRNFVSAGNHCLGNRSRFFEEKSGLVNLDVSCSHVGMILGDEGPLKRGFKSLIKVRLLWNHYSGLIFIYKLKIYIFTERQNLASYVKPGHS